ncbi:DUF2934 domain-containing protein [Hyalangium rubrum]|uniref:DUF2934 domain-containing protein n=1 Tax=Hyalangium rubrum TaxID=3103134 RepID=A0ABU5H630_9BACT|nr:DUF2934 domain-containing protein [Hyalangium sp. s54d21]MDY7228936.1 DUF2934 domain-containing protein [Hyalangium sp. s54d21]
MARNTAKASATPEKTTAKAPQTPEPAPARNGPSHEQIARRAYEIFLARGGVPGNETQDWFQAERELRLGRQ